METTPQPVQDILKEIGAPAPAVSDGVVLNGDYSLNRAGKAVLSSDPEAYVVLGGSGSVIPRAVAEKLGLKGLEEHVPYDPAAEISKEAAEKAELASLRAEVKALREKAHASRSGSSHSDEAEKAMEAAEAAAVKESAKQTATPEKSATQEKGAR